MIIKGLSSSMASTVAPLPVALGDTVIAAVDGEIDVIACRSMREAK